MKMASRILLDSNQWFKESSFMTTTISFLWICLFNEQLERCTIYIAILYQFRLRGLSPTYMTESLRSPYLLITLDTFSHIPVGMLHQHWWWVSAWTLMLHPSLVRHFMEHTHIPLCSCKEHWEGRYYIQTWAKIILFSYNFMDWPPRVSRYST
jgi:hypothetical protein